LRLGVINSDESLLPFPNYGGGAIITRNVISRLPKFFEVTYFPPIRLLDEVCDPSTRDALVSALRGLERGNMHVPQSFIEFFESRFFKLRLKERISEYSSLMEKEAGSVDYLFDPEYFHFNDRRRYLPLDYRLSDVFALSRRSGKRAFVEIMGLSDLQHNWLFEPIVHYVKYSPFLRPGGLFHAARFDIITRVYAHNLKKEMFAGVFALSWGSLYNLGLDHCAKCGVPNPALAIDANLLNYRKRAEEKEDSVVFFARLVMQKGLFELPFIFKSVLKRTETKLVVIGRFFSDRDERRFFDLLERCGVRDRVIWKGYLTGAPLFEEVSRSRVLVYPSHSDSFSFVIMESLAVGTPVVAYNIPGPYSVFAKLPAVKFVNEFDSEAMAEQAARLLKAPASDYDALMRDERVMEFLRSYFSWDDVAKSVAELIFQRAAHSRSTRGVY